MTESRKFNPAKRKKLNNPLRLQWIPPAQVWNLANPGNGREFADIGAGTGYLTRHIAEAANSKDIVVHALDIEPLMVKEMEQTLPQKSTIKPQLMKQDTLDFADNSIDGIWMIAVFHELTPPNPLLAEIVRVLRPGGKLVIVDWEKTESACKQGPPLGHRVETSSALALVAAAGLKNVQEEKGFQHHFCITARK